MFGPMQGVLSHKILFVSLGISIDSEPDKQNGVPCKGVYDQKYSELHSDRTQQQRNYGWMGKFLVSRSVTAALPKLSSISAWKVLKS